ncbi:MAG: ribonuclease R [Pseudomonadota bacterium]
MSPARAKRESGPPKRGRKAKDEDSKAIDRDAILSFIAENPDKTSRRDIARAFGIKGADRIPLKRLLRELIDEGLIAGNRKSMRARGTLPPVFVAEITGRTADGEPLARPTNWDEEDGAPPPIIVLPDKGKTARPLPGLGDRALIRLLDDDGGNERLATVIRLLERPSAGILALYRELGDGSGRLQPVDKKDRKEYAVEPSDSKDAREGELVAAEPIRSHKLGLPHARVVSRIGHMQDEHAVSLIALHAHGIPVDFPADALAEAEQAQPADMKGLEDFRTVPFITIDPADARDHDDAVHAEADVDPKNKGGHIVHVAIADVSRYVPDGGPLDRAARDRGNSIYFPGRVVPMLPEALSNDLCSLREKEDRPSLVARMVFDASGIKQTHSFHRAMIRSTAKLAYQDAQSAIDGRANDTTGPLLGPVLKPLWSAYQAIAKARDQRGPLDLDLPERKLVLDKRGRIKRVVIPERLEAHRLIEAFMIAANVAAAETLEQAKSPLIYRAHDAPSPEKIEGLREFLATLDINFARGARIQPRHFNHILAQTKDTPHSNLVNEVILRAQAQAEYIHENYGHFGLNLRRYAHFTSPIRRYADLIVHRALISAVGLGKDGLSAPTTAKIPEIAEHISFTERRAMMAERETVDRLIAHYLADRVGARFSGRITGVTRAGLFIRLDDTGADGFVPISSIDGDYWRHDEIGHQLVGERSGRAFRLGDNADVRLLEAVPVAGALRFEILSEARKLSGDEKRVTRKRTQGAAKRGRSAHKPRIARRR